MFNTTIYHYLFTIGNIMLWVQRSMLRVVRSTLHCLYQKCRYRIHLLRCQSSSNSIPSCNVHFATNAENLCGCDICGGAAASGGVSWLQMGFCVIFASGLVVFISSSGNCRPLNRKGKTSPSVFLLHPDVQGSICARQLSVQCLYW